MDKKSPKGRKRLNKGDENLWDCSVCTFRNNAEAFKCSMCDVRKGTSTRKPRLNADLVAAQVQQAQALTPPPLSSTSSKPSSPEPPSEEDEDSRHSVLEEEQPEEDETPQPPVSPETTTSKAPPTSTKKERKKKSHPEAGTSAQGPKKKYNINPAKLRNVDRSSATYHSVTVNDFTVVITEFKPKVKKEKLKKPLKKIPSSTVEEDEEPPSKKAANGESSPGPSEANGHEEAMRNSNSDAPDSRSS
uniref:RING1 and YY1-binding protein n=1 Tax=Caligus clemensi TaxID=344056 RepID=C1C2M9_CALCM|nr:RING1 and YY1-binding protein [Caligus clemensi]